MRRLKKRISALEKELSDLKNALQNLRVNTDAVPEYQVNVAGGTIPVKEGARAGKLELHPNGATLVMS